MPQLMHTPSAPQEEMTSPIFRKQRQLIICKVEMDAEIKENKPLYVPGLDLVQDLKLSVMQAIILLELEIKSLH